MNFHHLMVTQSAVCLENLTIIALDNSISNVVLEKACAFYFSQIREGLYLNSFYLFFNDFTSHPLFSFENIANGIILGKFQIHENIQSSFLFFFSFVLFFFSFVLFSTVLQNLF